MGSSAAHKGGVAFTSERRASPVGTPTAGGAMLISLVVKMQ